MREKKVLFICNPMYNYFQKIILEFELHGYDVDYYNDKPNESSLLKGIIKIKKNLINPLIGKYFDNLIYEIKDKSYDLILLVNCKLFTLKMVNQIRDIQKSARFVLYMWDSLELYPDNIDIIPVFDTAYSFDLRDCKKIEGLKFLPLFYCREFEEIGGVKEVKAKYDIISVCTAHPNRYDTMRILLPRLDEMGVRVFSYMYLNRLQYFYNKVFVPEFNEAKSSEFKFMPLPEKESLDALMKSNTVFDMPHSKQRGLTMRTIETLGAKRKLITTNTDIKKYDFFNENNILVMEKSSLSEIEAFINRKYENINNEIYKKYNISSWIESIINDIDNNYII